MMGFAAAPGNAPAGEQWGASWRIDPHPQHGPFTERRDDGRCGSDRAIARREMEAPSASAVRPGQGPGASEPDLSLRPAAARRPHSRGGGAFLLDAELPHHRPDLHAGELPDRADRADLPRPAVPLAVAVLLGGDADGGAGLPDRLFHLLPRRPPQEPVAVPHHHSRLDQLPAAHHVVEGNPRLQWSAQLRPARRRHH